MSDRPENPAPRIIQGIRERLEAHAEAREARQLAPKTPGAKRFTTDYAVAWGRAQGWRLIERESYDYRTKRHRDLDLGADVRFDDGGTGSVLVQGAGVGERADHRRRFEDRGGEDLAKRRGVRFAYAEFARGSKDPTRLEWWS